MFCIAGELTANGVAVMRRDVTLHGGTVLVVPEVLFVTHKVVQELRKHHRDKETPPLLAFPWWNAQFLSHSYLALEKNSNFTSMERLMNAAANLHLQVPGKSEYFKYLCYYITLISKIVVIRVVIFKMYFL